MKELDDLLYDCVKIVASVDYYNENTNDNHCGVTLEAITLFS